MNLKQKFKLPIKTNPRFLT